MVSLHDLARFPRPDRAREPFLKLDGVWDLEYDEKDVGMRSSWFEHPEFSRSITVPFCIESEASGVADPNPPRIVWYAKEFALNGELTGERILLHFGAVDYCTEVWLNGRRLGEHEGGYTPFSFDVTGELRDENLLVVRVADARSPSQPRGKQTLLKKAFFIFYPGVTGIWQPVWLEAAGRTYLERYQVRPDIDAGEVDLLCELRGDNGEISVEAEAMSPSGETFRGQSSTRLSGVNSEVGVRLHLGDFHWWSPENPSLYNLSIKVRRGSSRDHVSGYFGIRTVATEDNKILLNGRPLYQKLLLCQGYYPEGHYSPVDPGEFRRDVELISEMGFNGVRIHQKIEDPRFLYWCDRLGCLAWEEMPSAYRFGNRMRVALERQWAEAMDRDINHPCIIAWVPFNESWGVGVFPVPINLRKKTRKYVKRMYDRTKKRDPGRLVIDNSGYDHTSLTDVVDIHHYLGDTARCRKLYEELCGLSDVKFSYLRALKGAVPSKWNQNPFTKGEGYHGQPVMISEYGGFGFYKTGEGKSLAESFREYTELIEEQDHICGYCYTQFYDCYQEENGLLDFNRNPKVDIATIRAVNRRG